MAGSTPPVETPKLGAKATIAGLIFALVILVGFGAATAASYEDKSHHGDDHGEEHDDHSDEDKSHDDDHSDE